MTELGKPIRTVTVEPLERRKHQTVPTPNRPAETARPSSRPWARPTTPKR